MAGSDRLRIAIQKSGRLTEHSLNLMARCGLNFTRDRDHLVCYGENMPVDLMLVRDDDIPELVADGICDAGVLGQNVAREFSLGRDSAGFTERCELDYGRCRLALAAPLTDPAQRPDDLAGRRIATTYPRTTEAFLAENNINAEVVTLKGAVEIATRLGKADAVCDLVSTGATLRANRLREIGTVAESRAAVIVSEQSMQTEKEALLERMLRRIGGVMQVNESKYIMLHAPRKRLHDIARLLPGAESPTVLPLEGDADKVAVHAVCRESIFWETLENLQGAGASSVLVLPVEKMLA
ncbi:MAG TPA: ATP phosphoribosyltransferase [Gammaproteobacteria bacterium]|nr:ATP phosphoribosyltransferase [Gammaproteobacteria bacterium]